MLPTGTPAASGKKKEFLKIAAAGGVMSYPKKPRGKVMPL